MIRSLLERIDGMSLWVARAVTLAVFTMVVTIAYDVILRYVFRAPTVWQYDTSYMLGGLVIIWGAGYVHMKRRHVRVDILYNRFTPRVRLILDVFFTLLFFFPLFTGLIIVSAGYAIHSYQVKEFSEVGFWRPQMWPFRSAVALGLAVLWLQGLANFIRDMHMLVKGKEL